MPQVMALRASGRLKVSVTIGPSRATSTSSLVEAGFSTSSDLLQWDGIESSAPEEEF